MDLVLDVSIDAKRQMRLNTFGMPFPSYLYFELFCFALILKWGGLKMLGLGGRTVKARCAIIHLMKPELLHLG